MILELYCRDKEGKKILMKVIGGEFTFHFFAPLNKLCVSTNSCVEEYFCKQLEYSVNGNFVYASLDAEKTFNDNNSAKDCQYDDKEGMAMSEKVEKQLREQIEKMKCCSNCKNCRRKFIKENVFEHTCKVEHCKNYDKWEMKK